MQLCHPEGQQLGQHEKTKRAGIEHVSMPDPAHTCSWGKGALNQKKVGLSSGGRWVEFPKEAKKKAFCYFHANSVHDLLHQPDCAA